MNNMTKVNIDHATASDMTNVVTDLTVSPKTTDGISGKETLYTNPRWAQDWAYFNEHPDLKSALIQKSIWVCGKGYDTFDPQTKITLDNIKGYGKDTFDDILFNMDLTRRIGRDSFAEIIRNDKGILVNLKPLDPQSVRIVFDDKGMIKRYEQISKIGDTTKTEIKFQPQDIFHLTNNRIADSIHGISDIESLDKTLLAELESFDDTRVIMHRQARPFVIFKWKTDDEAKINAMKVRIDNLRKLGEDLHLPDDEGVLTWEVVQATPAPIVMAWREDIRKKFYRTIMLPELMPSGGGDSTESGGKIGSLHWTQIIEREQRYIEKQIWAQLYLKINLLAPDTISQEIQQDQSKDGAQQQMNFQQSDTKAGAGR